MPLADCFALNTAPTETHKTERYDTKVLEYLLSNPPEDEDDKRKVDKYKRGAKNGQHKVTYNSYKGYGTKTIGRYCVKSEVGLQAFSKNVRNALGQKHYWDIDIVNCHPVILIQLCKEFNISCPQLERYVKNREEIFDIVGNELGFTRREDKKRTIQMILFGAQSFRNRSDFFREFTLECNRIQTEICTKFSDLFDMVKKRADMLQKGSNPEGATLAIFLQTIERTLLLTLQDFLVIHKRELDVFIHDGGLIRKFIGESEPPVALLPLAQEYVKQHTGFDIQLIFKPMETTIQVPVSTEVIYPASALINDDFAAKKLSELAGPLLCKNSGKLFVFDTEKGIWTNEMDSIKGLIHRFKKDLVFLQFFAKGTKKFDYGGSSTNIPKMLNLVTNYVQEKVFNFDTSKGKLLFANGIYDMDTAEFKEGFDPEIHFAGRIDRPFPTERDLDYEEYVNRILFKDPYLEEQAEQAAFFKTALARALYGDYGAKRAYVSVGEPNCGRGLLTKSLGCAFGSFVTTFSSNNLLYNSKSSDDEAKKLAWFVPIANSRIAISNEISMMGKSVDSNILKAISSGGDKINARKLHENASDLISRTTVFLLTNDIPEMKPPDKGLINRLCVNELKKSYVANPDPSDPSQAKEDKKLMSECESPKWMDALFWLLTDEWDRFCQTDRVAPKPAAVVAGAEEWVEQGVGIKSLLTERYQITKSSDDYVAVREIHSYLKSKGCKDSETKRGREIRKMTGISKDFKKIDGKCVKVFYGIKEIVDN